MDLIKFEQIRYEVREHVAHVTLNRPERRNAWNGVMALEYRWALHHAETDPEVGVIVVSGAGKSFSVGADVAVLDEVDRAGGAYTRLAADLPPFPPDTPAGMRHNHTYPLALSKPVIAALNGACAGAGFVVATYADLRIAVSTAKITPSFAGLGLPAEYGIAWLLPKMIGLQNAVELLFTNAVMSGDDALAIGYVRRSWPEEEFLERVHEFAQDMAAHSSPSALAVMKRQLYVDAHGDLEDAYVRSVVDMNRMVGEADFANGMKALRDRRRPRHRPPAGRAASEDAGQGSGR